MTVTVTGIEAVVFRLRNLGDAVRQDIFRVVARWTVKLESSVKADKLSGQVLNVRTGRLRNSIHSRVIQGDGNVTGSVYANMAEAKYARFWEYGFTGIEHIREHLRMQTRAWGRPIDPVQVTVRAHDRNVDQAPRSYLRSTLQENADAIVADIAAVVGSAVASANG